MYDNKQLQEISTQVRRDILMQREVRPSGRIDVIDRHPHNPVFQ